MKVIIFTSLFALAFAPLFAQQKINWDQALKIDQTHFQGAAPQASNTGDQQYYLSASLDIGYNMSSYEFMFKKNFNEYVSVTLSPEHSWMQEGEYTAELLAYAQLQFDLLELYARKFRKSLYENKKAFSDANFITELYAEIGNEYSLHLSKIRADLASNPQHLEQHQLAVSTEIIELGDYCKECKPKKKK